jgi:hypothetical protein
MIGEHGRGMTEKSGCEKGNRSRNLGTRIPRSPDKPTPGMKRKTNRRGGILQRREAPAANLMLV